MDQNVPKWKVCSAGLKSAPGARYTLQVKSAVLLDFQTTGDGRDLLESLSLKVYWKLYVDQEK